LPHNNTTVDKQLTGTLPTELGRLIQLEHLRLGGNHFGTSFVAAGGDKAATALASISTTTATPTAAAAIPAGRLVFRPPATTAATAFDDGGGGGRGRGGDGNADAYAISVAAIPTQLGLLSRLQTLELMGNQLRGVIPSELGNLGACKRAV
jgi:hypothetical protein